MFRILELNYYLVSSTFKKDKGREKDPQQLKRLFKKQMNQFVNQIVQMLAKRPDSSQA